MTRGGVAHLGRALVSGVLLALVLAPAASATDAAPLRGSATWTPAMGPGALSPAAPTGVGEEVPLGTPGNGAAARGQHDAAVAWSGTQYLLVWQDPRGDEADVYGARVSSRGRLLDPTGIPISTAWSGQASPAVTWNGEHFVVAWEDTRRDGASPDVFAARVAPDGTVLDPDGIRVATAPFRQAGVGLASDGDVTLVVWEDDRDGDTVMDVHGARLTRAGTVLDPQGFTVSEAAGDQFSPSVAWGPGTFLVGWGHDPDGDLVFDVAAARVTPGGKVLDPDGIDVSSTPPDQFGVEVASDGRRFLIAWTQATGGSDVRGARVDADGTVLDPEGLRVATGPSDQIGHALAWDGTRYVVVWEDVDLSTGLPIFGPAVTRLSPDGRALDREGVHLAPGSPIQTLPSVAGGAGVSLAAWSELTRGGGVEVFGVRVSGDGDVLDDRPLLVSRAAPEQVDVALAWSGSGYLAAWQQWTDGGYDVYAARLDASGGVLDPQPIRVSGARSNEYAPAVAWDGTRYLVVWEQLTRSGLDVLGARVSETGALLDPAGIPISTEDGGQVLPAVAGGAGGFLVAWEDSRGGEEEIDVFAARVSGDGVVLDAEGIAVSSAGLQQMAPDVAFGGGRYLVVWEDTRSGSFTEVFGARLTAGGRVLDPDGIAVTDAPHLQVSPSVACTGASCLVVWADSREAPFSFDVFAARVSGGGEVLDPDGVRVCACPDTQAWPRVATHPRGYVVAWLNLANTGADVSGAWITSAGAPTGRGFAFGSTTDEAGVAIGASDTGEAVVAYDRFEPDPGYRARRAFVRAVSIVRSPGD